MERVEKKALKLKRLTESPHPEEADAAQRQLDKWVKKHNIRLEELEAPQEYVISIPNSHIRVFAQYLIQDMELDGLYRYVKKKKVVYSKFIVKASPLKFEQFKSIFDHHKKILERKWMITKRARGQEIDAKMMYVKSPNIPSFVMFDDDAKEESISSVKDLHRQVNRAYKKKFRYYVMGYCFHFLSNRKDKDDEAEPEKKPNLTKEDIRYLKLGLKEGRVLIR